MRRTQTFVAAASTLHDGEDPPSSAEAEQALEQVQRLRDRVAAAETVMEKLRKALDAGWDPMELREQYNAAVAEKRAAEIALAAAPDGTSLSHDELEAYVNQLGNVAPALDAAEPEELTELYSSLRLSLTYHHSEQIVDVEVDPIGDRVDKLRVRGGSRTLTTRLELGLQGPDGPSLVY